VNPTPDDDDATPLPENGKGQNRVLRVNPVESFLPVRERGWVKG